VYLVAQDIARDEIHRDKKKRGDWNLFVSTDAGKEKPEKKTHDVLNEKLSSA